MNRDIFKIELDHERRLANSDQLSVFRRNASAWELLLLLATEDREVSNGLYRLAEQVETDHLSRAALLKFMRDQRRDGRLVFEPHCKRSMWRVRPDDAVLDELQKLLTLRNRLLSNAERAQREREKRNREQN